MPLTSSWSALISHVKLYFHHTFLQGRHTEVSDGSMYLAISKKCCYSNNPFWFLIWRTSDASINGVLTNQYFSFVWPKFESTNFHLSVDIEVSMYLHSRLKREDYSPFVIKSPMSIFRLFQTRPIPRSPDGDKDVLKTSHLQTSLLNYPKVFNC